jgi:succinyl-CoA synthetase alpha subunit
MYRDSVALMRLSTELTELPGIIQASAVMATAANLALLAEAGLIDGQMDAGPDELLIVIEGEDEAMIDAALVEAETALSSVQAASAEGEGARHIRPRSLAMAVGEAEGPTLALISTPGEYAASEALKALRLGLNVMIFSDHVSIEDEFMLKQIAATSDLLVMGPDCGTAIIDGVPLGFANEVRRGDIGIVAASGTGLQQVCCLIDRYGKGISHAIGTGGRDLKTAVGGITMTQGLTALAEDPGTSVIVLISKPPAPEVADRIVSQARAAGKPVVINFLGVGASQISGEGVFAAKTLEHAAKIAVAIVNDEPAPAAEDRLEGDRLHEAEAAAGRLQVGQRYVRGLYCGGTFCYEAVMLLHDALGGVWSNTPREADYLLSDPWSSVAHTIIDLGTDEFTRGRPHPMIDHRARNDRLTREAEDPETAVILFDVVLGHGSHADPAGTMLPAIHAARRSAAAAGRDIVLIGSVCGTEQDPQKLSSQEQSLRDAGAILAESNAESVRLVAAILERIE